MKYSLLAPLYVFRVLYLLNYFIMLCNIGVEVTVELFTLHIICSVLQTSTARALTNSFKYSHLGLNETE